MAKDKLKSIYSDTGLGIGEFIESGGGAATISKVAKQLGGAIKGTKSLRRTNKSGAYTPNPNVTPARQIGRSAVKHGQVSAKTVSRGELSNPPKAVPNALEASLSSAPSKAVGTATTPPKASFQKTKSTIVPTRKVSTKPSPIVTGQISQKNHMKMEPKVSSSSAPKPTSAPSPSKQVTNPKGLLSKIGAALTKSPTPRGPSEYEQIMRDIQPSRKKKK